jgi:hypothetical protein
MRLGYVPFTAVGSELLFEVFSQRHERGATLVMLIEEQPLACLHAVTTLSLLLHL